MTAPLDTAEQVWQLRDWVSTMDDPDADPAAAQLIGIYNRLLIQAGAATAE